MKTFTTYLVLCLFTATSNAQSIAKSFQISDTDTYLNFPVDLINERVPARIMLEGQSLDEFDIRLADGEPLFWVFFDVTKYRGETLQVEVAAPNREAGLAAIHADANFPGQENLYAEKYRPQAAFSSRRGWINDPNGLIHYNGEYHLFYQHNPYGWNWGNMHWGHAVSTDLVHWRELPDALTMPHREHAAFSGTATTDPANTAGFRRNGIDPLIAFYTRTGSGEHIALSYDNGRTFEEFDGNPVLEHRGRDPKVFWFEPGGHWIMVVFDESTTRSLARGQDALVRRFAIYTSSDMKTWTFRSAIEGFWECPELFEIPVAGEPGETKWVMYDADGEYLVGNFNGLEFTPEQGFRQFDFGGGGHFYASQTFNQMPDGDERRVQIGWLRGILSEGMPFNQSMTFPTELRLRRTSDGLRLTPTPVREIERLYGQSHIFNDILLSGNDRFSTPVKSDVMHIIAEFDPGDVRNVGLHINGYRFEYNPLESQIGGVNYIPSSRDHFRIEAIVDKVNIQIFVNDGERYFVMPLNSVDAVQVVEAYVGTGTGESNRFGNASKAVLKHLEVHELNSIWRQDY